LIFQDLILTMERYWAQRGVTIQQPYVVEVGAGTMSPHTFLRVSGPSHGPSPMCSHLADRPTAGTATTPTGSSSTISTK